MLLIAMEKQSPQLKYCLYARKSSESDERQAMSIDSQLAEMRALAVNEGLNVVCELQESHSAKDSGKRPVYNQMLASIANDEYNAVLTWAPDRLSRNAGDLGSVVDLMDQYKLLHIRTYSQTFTNSPNEKFLLMILCSQAKLENDNKSVNVKRGIRMKCEMGWRPGTAPLGYINRAFAGVNDIIPDPERADTVTEMFHKAAQGWSGRRLKAWLDEQGIMTRNGRAVPVSSILAMLINPFYYGEFQYPEGPGNPWYKGAHKPLVSKELWNEVQQSRGVNKGIWGSKQFAFRGLLMCGQCGAEVTAQEKIKLLKKTGVHKRFVYYNCTRKIDPNCKEKYINEDLLCELLEPLIEKEVKKIRVTPKLQAKIDRHYAVAQNILRQYGVERPPATPLVEYSRYVLRSGSETEKTAFANGITNNIAVKNGVLIVQK